MLDTEGTLYGYTYRQDQRFAPYYGDRENPTPPHAQEFSFLPLEPAVERADATASAHDDIRRNLAPRAEIADRVAHELAFRRQAWHQLLVSGGPRDVSRALIRELKIYGGAQGIWVDAERTRGIGAGGSPVAVGLLHTGRHYADDLSPTGIVYHYPRTNRGAGRDASEIEATKQAAELVLPVFVVTPSPKSAQSRDVHLGWVVNLGRR